MTHVNLDQIYDVFHVSALSSLETGEVTALRRSEWVKGETSCSICSPVRIDFSNKGHGDREIDEFTIGHADFERLCQSERREVSYQRASTLDCDMFFKVKKLTAPS